MKNGSGSPVKIREDPFGRSFVIGAANKLKTRSAKIRHTRNIAKIAITACINRDRSSSRWSRKDIRAPFSSDTIFHPSSDFLPASVVAQIL